MSISMAKDRLSELVEQSVSTAEQFTITRNGAPAAVLIGVQEWDSLQETLIWLAQEGIHQDVADARLEQQQGRTYSEAEIREHFAGVKRIL